MNLGIEGLKDKIYELKIARIPSIPKFPNSCCVEGLGQQSIAFYQRPK
jgi:hypothetical protein